MPQIKKSKKLPYSCEQMFDLVADVEQYPKFLPWCSRGVLERRTENEIIGTITAQKGAFQKSFTTRNLFVYPKTMNIALIRGPFKHLSGRWDFIEQEDGGCEVCYQMNFEVPFFLLPVLGGLVEHMGNTMVEAFAKRAMVVYGNHKS